MPELHFTIQWPNGMRERCYSPSTVMRDFLVPGASYPIYEFIERAQAGLNIGSERVRAKYGYYCTAAMDQLAKLQVKAAEFDPMASLLVVEFTGKPGASPDAPSPTAAVARPSARR